MLPDTVLALTELCPVIALEITLDPYLHRLRCEQTECNPAVRMYFRRGDCPCRPDCLLRSGLKY